MFIISIIAYIFATTKREVNKFEGLLMVLIYISYMVFIIIRQ
ncbi:hypothetical protein H477_2035 [[Clostridium] sordellii ATCC 9714]|nr:hypothetical protein H477_2035 [[Clostridium] sordellii ATCC 9714] [Paeniclostridium sordellii ATCC 9714]